MAHQRKTASQGVERHGGQRAAVEVRRPAPVVRRPDAAPVLRGAVSAVRRGTGRAKVYAITGARVAATHERTRTTLRWAIRKAVVYIATRAVGAGAAGVGGAYPVPLRADDAPGRAGR
jgi:hypothetical protein